MAQVASLRTVPQQARGRDKLARMLAAADLIMATEGADAITTTRIAADAGISVGSVYHYLPHRGAIIEALAAHYLGLLEDQMDRLVAMLRTQQAPRADLVGDAVDVFAEFYREHPGFRALWFGRHLTAETRELDHAHKQRMALGIRSVLVAQGIGRNDKKTLRISLAVQLATDALLQEAFRASPNGNTALLNELKTMIASYLAALTTN
jgi:AcrR family transcriptional regulator